MRHWLLLLMLLALPSAAPLSRSIPSSTLPFPSSTPTTPIPYREQRGDGSTGGGGKAMPSSFARKQQQQQQQQQPPPDSGNPTSDLSSLRRPAVGAPMPLGRPPWLTVKAPSPLESPSYKSLSSSLSSSSLKTVCEEARCPNQSECWSVGTATVMLLGDTCTRGCSFCAVKTSRSPPPPDASEPARVAMQIADWGLKYVVITVVDRDDLPDGGAAHIAETVRLCKSFSPGLLVEVLVGDWWGKGLGPDGPIDKVLASGLDVYAHNVETVERLQPYVRDGRAGYRQSLATLKCAKDIRPQVLTKSSLMLGLGESRDEVLKTMEDLRREGVDVVTFGQYLKPMEGKLSVVEYVHPDEFDFLRVKGEEMGFKYVASGPLVRSSYRAGEYFMENMIKANKASDLAKETARL